MNVELLKVEYLLSNANLFFNHSLNITSKKKKKWETESISEDYGFLILMHMSNRKSQWLTFQYQFQK